MRPLHLLCAGAAQGLVKALQERWAADSGAEVQGRFGAVGAMKEALLGGAACDVMVVTDAMVAALAAEGLLDGGTRVPLGRVHTGIAVPQGQPRPDVATPEALRAALLAADALYFPDPLRATAGIHFAGVMRALGIHDELQPRFRTYASGAAAMRELAAAHAPRLIGCTQLTEINDTGGVDLVGALPAGFERATVYSAAVAARSSQPTLAARYVALLGGPETQALRRAGGFEV